MVEGRFRKETTVVGDCVHKRLSTCLWNLHTFQYSTIRRARYAKKSNDPVEYVILGESSYFSEDLNDVIVEALVASHNVGQF